MPYKNPGAIYNRSVKKLLEEGFDHQEAEKISKDLLRITEESLTVGY